MATGAGTALPARASIREVAVGEALDWRALVRWWVVALSLEAVARVAVVAARTTVAGVRLEVDTARAALVVGACTAAAVAIYS